MIKVSILYPRTESSTFDMDYYLNHHIPMVRDRLGATLKGVAVEEGLGGGEPGAPPAYAAMGHLWFDSVESFQEAIAPHAEAFMGDIPNYTNTQPTVQISAVHI